MRISKLLVTPAAVLLCVALCVTSWAGVYQRELVEAGDFGFGIFERVEMSASAGGLVLSKSMNCVPYIWVPSPSDCVVSKIDARSGKEMARYRMGPEDSNWSPCAVATDSAGNAYVACGGSGSGYVVKIQVYGASRSIRPTADSTSFDFNGDGKADVLPWGKDARVSVVAEVGSEPSTLIFDEQGVLWVGLWGEQSIVAVDMITGKAGGKVYLTGKPHTMITGSRGSIWVLCGEARKLVCVDPLLASVRSTFDLGDADAQSMCAGDEKTIWLGTTQGLARFDTSAGAIVARSRDMIALGGVVLDRGDSVWAACPRLNQLTKFSPTDLSTVAQVSVGRTPVSVTADSDGYIWALNADSASASRVDPRSVTRAVTAHTASSPFSSTPFAACALKPGISPSGGWRGLFDSGIRGAAWGTISWDATYAASKIIVEARSAETPTAIGNQMFQQVSNGQEFALPNGRFLEVRVSFDGGLNTTPVLRGLKVSGRNLAPDVSNAAPTRSLIRRLDRKSEMVGILGVVDPEGDDVTVTVTGVTQDEPVAGLWEGDKGPDAVGVGKPEVELRGECNPGTDENPGNGRVYTISFRATDSNGASSTGKVKVMVPASLKWDATAVEDKDKYDSTKDPSKDAG